MIVEAVIKAIVVCRHLDIAVGYLVVALLAKSGFHSLAVGQDSQIKPRALPSKNNSESW